MITLTGQIDLNKEQAPAVTLRIGDTMRQTELTVDNAIDLSECTAELYMVKPDSTFVIAACTITEDNTIIVSWPEQAAAVKGLGEYCIRISSVDPAYVYSARGPVWIDDHVVTEDMIESVAEVNGYTFPDDFATKDDVASNIDDDVISLDKTWSSQKINNEFINSMQHYSATEHVIGFWVDNKPIYEKTILIPSLTASTDNLINVDVPFIERLIRVFGCASVPTIPNMPIPMVSTYMSQYCINPYSIDSSNKLHIDVGSIYTGTEKLTNVYVTIQYTKTTD